jgi:hypothetical protein
MKIQFALQMNTVVWLHMYAQIGEFQLHGVCFSIMWAFSRIDLVVLKEYELFSGDTVCLQ